LDSTTLYVLKRPDGTFKFYVDPDYAKDQGISPDRLISVDVPNSVYATGSIDDVSTFIALQLEERASS
jgi:hypothetical protein